MQMSRCGLVEPRFSPVQDMRRGLQLSVANRKAVPSEGRILSGGIRKSGKEIVLQRSGLPAAADRNSMADYLVLAVAAILAEMLNTSRRLSILSANATSAVPRLPRRPAWTTLA